MKILLTGEPGSGKTTLLESFVKNIPNKQGFIAREVRKDGERVGFELVSFQGRTATLANIDSKSEKRVGRYGVEVDELDSFLKDLASIHSDGLLYIDEIGKMELFSDSFKELVLKYLDASNPYVGTITSIYRDDFTEQILARVDIILLTVTPHNRDQVKEVLRGFATNIELLGRIDAETERSITQMAKGYVENSQFVQLKKLLKNALRYVAEDRVTKLSPNEYLVKGNTNDHMVNVSYENVTCDCDLFRGSGKFQDAAGECSHIQAVKLTSPKLS